MTGRLTVRVVSARDLTFRERERWAELQEGDPSFASPFFSPEFTLCVAAVRDDVAVAVIRLGGRTVGFFPFQREGRTASPVGGTFSDYQGVVLQPGVHVDPAALIRACGLREWWFDHILASQQMFQPFHHHLSSSPRLDMSGGFAEYAAARRRDGSRVVTDAERKARKLEREMGPLRFIATCDDREVLRQVLRWKSEQYVRTGAPDVLADEWSVALIERVLGVRSARFAGMLSALYAGDQLVAGHIGLRSRYVWHWWLPAYDVRAGSYSPGAILLLRMAEAAADVGISAIDLGRGEQGYKERFKTDECSLAEGVVGATALIRGRRNLERAARRVRGYAAQQGVLRPDSRGGATLRRVRSRSRALLGSVRSRATRRP